jgi:WhiB family redox-sensing transcriptional regulator
VKWLISPLQMAQKEGFRVEILEQLMKRLYLCLMAETSRLPRPVADEWEWQYEGACRDLPSEMFFHPDGERGPRRRNRENTAKAVCASCPVIAACRAHALAVQEPYGIWGGLSEDDRLEIIAKPIGISQTALTHAS